MRQQPVPSNAAQPRANISAPLETRQIPPSRNEHLLRQIIRLREVVKLPGEIAAQHQFITPHHLQIQICLPALDAVEQGSEIGFVGVHAGSLLAFLSDVPLWVLISQKKMRRGLFTIAA